MVTIERTRSKNDNDALPLIEMLCVSHPVRYLRKQPRNCASSKCHQSTASTSVYSLRSEQDELEANRPT